MSCHVPKNQELDTQHRENVRSDDITGTLHCAKALIFLSCTRSVPGSKVSRYILGHFRSFVYDFIVITKY
jgi:hypothetical protein